MHAVFLYHAIRAGMDLGIVNAGQLTVYDEIPPQLLTAVEDVILNRHPEATDRLVALAGTTKDKAKKKAVVELWRQQPIAERLSHALVNGITKYLEPDITEALDQGRDPLQIIAGPLAAGLDAVGELFASGKMFLPQVVKSARVMKKAVDYLQPLIEAGKTRPAITNGKILLATVRGDVHDIGKNIVGVILGCNGYEVVDLGIMVPAEKICATAREANVDVIGLSGLITPSLHEMMQVAREMERQDFNIPLLIGGAATSLAHTAAKIEPLYHGPTAYVADASRAARVVKTFLGREKAAGSTSRQREHYAHVRQRYHNRTAAKTILSLAEARQHKAPIDWRGYTPRRPRQSGVTTFEDYGLKEIVPHINWTPFFAAWDLHGRYPQIFAKQEIGPRARELFDHADRLLQQICERRLLRAKAAVGFFPANSCGDDIKIYADDRRLEVQSVIHGLRQQTMKGAELSTASLADFIAPEDTAIPDYLGAFVVSTGFGAEDLAAKYKRDHDDFNSIMVKLLADRLAEAFAEHLHERVRTELWGYAPMETSAEEDLDKKKCRGIRPAPGYPACPDHTEKKQLWRLLAAEKTLGVELTENFAMRPAATVAGWYFAHPQSFYFHVGRIGKDQVIDYAQRKNMTVAEVERWLAPHLAYQPARR
ncbi:vitamin B12 dependent-methionine synthase activation domain-containing protein [Candidatus Zixiibacteriota bacterium]